MDKETIIFLHGIVGNKNAFKMEMETLKSRYNCFAYDFYNPDDLADSDFSLEFLLDQLYAHFINENIEKAHLCTLSFGCIVASAFAKRYPSMVMSMTFVGGYLCKVPAQYHRNVAHVLEVKERWEYDKWIQYCASLLNPNSVFLAEDSEKIYQTYALQLESGIFEQALRIQLEFDSQSALAGINLPILWVMGEYDELFKSTLTSLHQLIPHVEYRELKNAGHAAHAHQHDQFMSVFQSFLKRNRSTQTVLVHRQ
ncbi:alpha/beta fold hydrolase [Mesobacillus maritimus]|uniref:alpha/beta fold hydrolase n=1 Tax=Mesobacillus maritimus TaxID=1643336 RepID=UPI00384D392B